MAKSDETQSAYIQGIRRCDLYIRDHIGEDLSLEKVAQIAGFSPYHFHRIFRAFMKESLNQYVRRLRIEKSADKVKYHKKSITDIALESGYETPSSFSSAFKKQMGKTPKEYRAERLDENDRLKSKMEKENKMNSEIKAQDPTIQDMDDQDLIFIRETGSYQEAPKRAFIKLTDFLKNEHPELLKERKFGIALDNPYITNEENLRFDACVVAPKDTPIKGEVTKMTLKGGKFAIFKHIGSYESLSDTFDAIFKTWFIKNKDKVANRDMFCEYLNMEMNKTDPSKLETLIYIPLKGQY